MSSRQQFIVKGIGQKLGGIQRDALLKAFQTDLQVVADFLRSIATNHCAFLPDLSHGQSIREACCVWLK